MSLNEKLTEHISKRPISTIVNASTEKSNEIALKLFCVIDFFLDRDNIYSEIQAAPTPKLFQQLIGFHTFENFQYYDYRSRVPFNESLFQCKRCDLVDDYLVILTHMTLSHNLNIGLHKCIWCGRKKMTEHIDDETFDQCYEAYKQKYHIDCDRVLPVVKQFYKMIGSIAEKIGVKTRRTMQYTANGYKKNEQIKVRDEDIPYIRDTVVAFRRRQHNKNIKIDELNHLFTEAMAYFYAGCILRKYEIKHFNGAIETDTDDVANQTVTTNQAAPSMQTEAETVNNATRARMSSQDSVIILDSFEPPVKRIKIENQTDDDYESPVFLGQYVTRSFNMIKRPFHQSFKNKITECITNFMIDYVKYTTDVSTENINQRFDV